MRWLPSTFLALTLLVFPAPAAGVEPNLTDIWVNVFQPACSTCHFDDSGLGFWADSKLNSWTTLVNQPALFCDDVLRVVPGDAAASHLVRKLEGTMACGDQMPLGDLPLEETTIAAIRAWIDAGAVFESPVPAGPSTWSAIKSLYR